jgi:hypothetical protein
MALDDITTLRVGDVAVLHIPSDRPYLPFSNGAADVLALVKQSGRDVTLRAVHEGRSVIVVSPDVADGECISCATLHYFVRVVSEE